MGLSSAATGSVTAWAGDLDSDFCLVCKVYAQGRDGRVVHNVHASSQSSVHI